MDKIVGHINASRLALIVDRTSVGSGWMLAAPANLVVANGAFAVGATNHDIGGAAGKVTWCPVSREDVAREQPVVARRQKHNIAIAGRQRIAEEARATEGPRRLERDVKILENAATDQDTLYIADDNARAPAVAALVRGGWQPLPN